MSVHKTSRAFFGTLLISFFTGCSRPTDKADTPNHKQSQSSESVCSNAEAERAITADFNFDQDEIDAFVEVYPQFKQAQMMNL